MVKISNQKIRQSTFHEKKLLIEFIGKIRDSLHNTIPFTKAEKVIIDSPEFQRLRRLSQTGFIYYIFPGATHSRFEHSLGAMHVASLLYKSILSNQRYMLNSLENAFSSASDEMKKNFLDFEKKFGSLKQTDVALATLERSDYLIQCLRFAALLHDCGHGPFSHSSEKFMITWKKLDQELETLDIPSWLKEPLRAKSKKMKSMSCFHKEKRISHEIFTLFIISRLFQHEDPFLSPQMGQDICAVIDLSISPHPAGELYKTGLQTLLHEMISGEIDADRMDYLLRDSMKCGVVYGYFDLERILDSVGFYLDLQTNDHHLSMRKSGISAFEDYLRARHSMYQQVYFHKTATACEAMLECVKNQFPEYHLPIELDDYLQIDDASFLYHLKEKVSPQKLNGALNLMRDLIYDRKIWKKVYEETSYQGDNQKLKSVLISIVNELKNQGILCEMIESSANLTCFSEMDKDSDSKNKFKIILKDIHSLRHVEPVEKHSLLVKQLDKNISIKRIFVSRCKENGDLVDIQSIQNMISERLIFKKN